MLGVPVFDVCLLSHVMCWNIERGEGSMWISFRLAIPIPPETDPTQIRALGADPGYFAYRCMFFPPLSSVEVRHAVSSCDNVYLFYCSFIRRRMRQNKA